MEKIGVMRSAIQRGVERAGAGMVPSRVEITVHDPCRITPGAVHVYATQLLRERGLGDVYCRTSRDRLSRSISSGDEHTDTPDAAVTGGGGRAASRSTAVSTKRDGQPT